MAGKSADVRQSVGKVDGENGRFIRTRVWSSRPARVGGGPTRRLHLQGERGCGDRGAGPGETTFPWPETAGVP